MLGELEDADESDDAQERQRRARLGAGTAHGRQNVEQRHVVGHDGRHVDDVLEVLPEVDLRRTGDEADDRLEGEPGGARGLDDEEGVEEVGRLVVDAVRQGEGRQRLDAEEHDRNERHHDRQDRDAERRPRRVRVLEQLPDSTQVRVARHRRHLRRNIAARHASSGVTLNYHETPCRKEEKDEEEKE